VRSALLTSDELAQSVREVHEQEHGVIPSIVERMTVAPNPKLKPGSVIGVVSTTAFIDSIMYVTGVRHDFDQTGFWTELSARSASAYVTEEDDPATEPLDAPPTSTRHIGQTDISWYRVPEPHGLTVDLPFHPGGDYRGVRVTGRYHGANSWRSGSKADTPSEVHIRQGGVSIGSAPLPWHGEAYTRRNDYDDDQYWDDFDVMIAADIVDASADIRFTSGTARDDSRDEYEIKEVEVRLYAEATEQGAVSRSGADWHAYQSRRVWRWAS
jgi:hypothetical protein